MSLHSLKDKRKTSSSKKHHPDEGGVKFGVLILHHHAKGSMKDRESNGEQVFHQKSGVSKGIKYKGDEDGD